MPWHIHRSAFQRRRLAAFAAVLVIAGGAACSAASTPFADQQRAPAPTAAPAGGPAVAARSAAAPPVPAAIAANGASVAAGAPATAPKPAEAQSQATDAAVADTSAQVLDRMVIRAAQLSVEVQDMESALSQARAIASRAGGFVSASDTHIEKVNDKDNMVANLTLQVRSDSADSAMSDLRGLGKVTAESSGSQDVTDEYVDLNSNLRNLQASEAAILKLMDKATQIQDVLSLQRELTQVRGQIERIQGRKTYLERRTDMATITLALRLPAAASTSQTSGGAWDPVATALRGWQASLSMLRGTADVVIVVLAFSWWLLPFVALGGFIWYQRRRRGPVQPIAPATPAA
jgi:Domain of unknown function (DUF4349)